MAGDVATPREPGTSRARALALPSRVRQLHALTIVVVLIALVATAVLVGVTRRVHDNNEERLLRQRAQQAATVASASISGLQAPLASSAVLAETTDGAAEPFMKVMRPIVETGTPFSSASLWSLGATDPAPLVVAGAPPLLASAPASEQRELLERAAATPGIAIHSMLSSPDRRIGYAYTAGPGSRYVVYAEANLPKQRRARIARNSAFADLDYAIYLGPRVESGQLLASSSGRGIPADTRQESAAVPFGDSQLLLVVTARSQLGGELLEWLPWILLGIGLVATVVAGVLTEYLIRRREHAEELADRLESVADLNRELYDEQREVAETLQRSLMPQELSTIPGCEVAARYEAGVEGTEVGGDWFDLLPLSPQRLLFSVGDVSGRGLEAAATMASLRYAMRAYALERTSPGEILHKLTMLMNVARNELFATVICGLVDTSAGTLTVARAGHLDLLVVSAAGARFLDAPLGPAIGMVRGQHYDEMTVALDQGSTYLAFTDGLVERRNEHLDVGLERLRAACDASATVGDLVNDLVEALARDSTDDIALLGLRWTQAVPRLENEHIADPRTA